MDRLPLLVLVRNITRTASYNDDWQDAFRAHPGFTADIEDIEIERNHPHIKKKIERASFIVALHSSIGNGTQALDALEGALKNRGGKLGVFVGNEVNLPFPTMRSKLGFLKRVQPDLIATQLIEETGRWYYQEIEGAIVRTITHAINGDAFKPGPQLNARPVDIGARSDRYNVYVGDNQRVALHALCQRKAETLGLIADIELGGARFDRKGWAAFLANAKGTIATEAGSAFLDRDDRLSAEVDALLRRRQGSKMVIRHESWARSLVRVLMPRAVRHAVRRQMSGMMMEDIHLHESIDQDIIQEIQMQVFRPERQAPLYTKCISSRHFDAAACKTVQILTTGRYNDILQPDRHYIELEADFANIDDVLERCRDLGSCQRMVDSAYDDLMSSHRYDHRMTALERVLRDL